jgi:hypothetical protein
VIAARAQLRSSPGAHFPDPVAHAGYNLGFLCELICFARKRNFMPRPATNWHDGQITQNLSSPSRKNIPLSSQPKSSA